MTPQIDSVPIQLAAWLGCLAFFIGMLNGLLKISDRIKGKGLAIAQPVRFEEEHSFAKERDCIARSAEAHRALEALRVERSQDLKEASVSRENVRDEITSVRDEIGEMERRLNTADEMRTLELHKRINAILEAVGEVRGKLEA